MEDLKERSPYVKLAFAVIKQAFFDSQYKGDLFEEKQVRDEALNWIRSEDSSRHSFNYWCQLADLDPGTIRKGLLKARIDWGLKDSINNVFKHNYR